MMAAYYNEIDPTAANWLRWLIDKGHIAPGDVDTRSIAEVQPDDLIGYTQAHFFAGIGGWSHAARLAGWPDDRALWTGSCPCQPFSVAGKRGGADDVRHLWPDFFRLIRAARPPVVMGEQVAGQAGYGWFDGVGADLAGEGYAGRSVDIPALAVDAPHIRSRLYWLAVADAESQHGGRDFAVGRPEERTFDGRVDARNRVVAANAHCGGGQVSPARQQPAEQGSLPHVDTYGRNGSFWSDADWTSCHDGKARRTEPGTPMLVDGFPGRVAAWRGVGNAIVPQLAAEVIAAFMDTHP